MSFYRYIQFFIFIHACTSMIQTGFCEHICPPVTEFHDKQTIKAEIDPTISGTITWKRPDNEGVLTCEDNADDNNCTANSLGYSGKRNGTISRLIIEDVRKRDSGMWTLKIFTEDTFDICYLVTARKPNCNVTSDVETDDLDLGDEVTLTVDIAGYYCSDIAAFDLTTGDDTQILVQNHRVEDGTSKDSYDKVVNTTFDVNLSQFGDVTLFFSCNSRTWPLTCDGVKKLIKSMPQCNISSDKNTDELDLGGDLTLTAYIRGYYCPKAAVFTLTTGDIQQMSQNFSVDNVTNTDINTTFNVTLSHFGKVTLQYTCDGDTWELACGGVKELVKRRPSTTTHITSSNAEDHSSTPRPVVSTASRETTTFTVQEAGTTGPGLPIPIIAGASAGGLLLIVVIVIIVVNRRKLQRVAQKYIVERRKNPNIPYLEDEIPAGYWPEDLKDMETDDIKMGPLDQTAVKRDEKTGAETAE